MGGKEMTSNTNDFKKWCEIRGIIIKTNIELIYKGTSRHSLMFKSRTIQILNRRNRK
jgi:hypothetical protein